MSYSDFTATYSNEEQFSGVFAHIRDEIGGNPLEKGVVSLTCPTQTHPEYPLRNLLEYIDLLDKCFWNFANCDPSPHENWVQFDFIDHQLSLTGYTIRSGGSSHPKSWTICGSNDETNWEDIDSIQDCQTLNGPRKTQTFQCSSPSKPYRYIRYVQSDNQSPKPERKFRINMKAIEFFGTISHI